MSSKFGESLFERELNRGHEEQGRDWIRARIQQIHGSITVFDVLRFNGVDLKSSGSNREEQISCPFHGVDGDPSARVYPASASGPSGVWCFVCNEQWDCIGLWKKFRGSGDQKFSSVLFEIEKAFGLQIPEGPAANAFRERAPDKELEEVREMLELCEKRLRVSKPSFTMESYLRLGQALDRVTHQVSKKLIKSEQAKIVLRKILDKIGEKVRECPDDSSWIHER